LIEESDQNARLRFEYGIHTLGRYFRLLCDRLYSHSRIAFALQELPGGLDNTAAGVVGLTLANQGFVRAMFYFRQEPNCSIVY
jgi:hypothetical protein